MKQDKQEKKKGKGIGLLADRSSVVPLTQRHIMDMDASQIEMSDKSTSRKPMLSPDVGAKQERREIIEEKESDKETTEKESECASS